MKSSVEQQRQRRSDGERTYQAIVRASAQLATIEGLHGLSISRLADHVGISKSGLYAHFRSKEELQLATIEAAGQIFDEEVVRPTDGEPTARGTLEALCERFFSHVERRVFPGGCFFAAASAEIDTHQGRVRDRISEFMLGWIDKLQDLVLAAQKEGTISTSEDPAQLAYELESHMLLANNLFVLTNDPAMLERGRRAIRRRLAQK
jgi:AcrR family transcriptional regulator